MAFVEPGQPRCQTVRFGIGLDEAEGKSILKEVAQRYPGIVEGQPGEKQS